MKIVAVTACITGVAHTYMAAEQIKKICKKKNISVVIETQGALGLENELKADEIAAADAVIIASDIKIEGNDRFKDSKKITTPINIVLKKPELLIEALANIKNVKQSSEIKLA